MNWNRLKQEYDHHDVTFPLPTAGDLLCDLWELLNYSEVLFMDR